MVRQNRNAYYIFMLSLFLFYDFYYLFDKTHSRNFEAANIQKKVNHILWTKVCNLFIASSTAIASVSRCFP